MNELKILYQNKCVGVLPDMQSLYLYPLSLIDYAIHLKECYMYGIYKALKLSIYASLINVDDLDINKSGFFSNIKEVEFIIDEEIHDTSKLLSCIDLFVKKQVKITFNIKALPYLTPTVISKVAQHGCYYKIHVENSDFIKKEKEVKEKLAYLNYTRNADSRVLVKIYICTETIHQYKNWAKMLDAVGVDVFQISKSLLPVNAVNQPLSEQLQSKLHALPSQCGNMKIWLVKDVSTIWYDRFEIDNRNSHICYACWMQPYLIGNRIYPCKVNNVIHNFEKWSTKIGMIDEYVTVIKQCGRTCTDCASIFENDSMNYITSVLREYEPCEIDFTIDG